MKRIIKILIASTLCFASVQSNAQEVPAQVRSAVEKQLLSQLEIKPVEMGEVAEKVFREPIYKVKPILKYISVVDGKVLNLRKPNTSVILKGYQALIRDDFLLDSKEKADVLEKAFETVFPYGLKKQVRPVKVDHGWIIFRDDFFKSYVGLIFTTDKKGKITKVEYVLKINPETYAYSPPTNSQ